MTTEEKLVGVLVDVFDLDPSLVVDDMAKGTVEAWDSLRHMELIVALEAAFGIRLEFAEIQKMENVGNIKQVLKARVG